MKKDGFLRVNFAPAALGHEIERWYIDVSEEQILTFQRC